MPAHAGYEGDRQAPAPKRCGPVTAPGVNRPGHPGSTPALTRPPRDRAMGPQLRRRSQWHGFPRSWRPRSKQRPASKYAASPRSSAHGILRTCFLRELPRRISMNRTPCSPPVLPEWHLPTALVRLEISLQELDEPSFYRRDVSGFAKRDINSTSKISRNFGVTFTNNQTARRAF